MRRGKGERRRLRERIIERRQRMARWLYDGYMPKSGYLAKHHLCDCQCWMCAWEKHSKIVKRVELMGRLEEREQVDEI